MDFFFFRNVQPEDEKNFVMALEKAFGEAGASVIMNMDDMRKLKKSEYDKQRYQDKKNTTADKSEKSEKAVKNSENIVENSEKPVEKVEFHKEEREEEERSVSPLLSPLPFSPNTPYPITPIIPSSQKEEEREENVYAAGAKDRGELLTFGEFVKLSASEYQRLCKDYGKIKADQMIQGMNRYIGEDETGKLAKKYQTRNHNLTLRNWENRHEREVQAKQPKQIPKEKTFRDLRIEMEAQEQEDVIDSFWRV